jgi:hypothetical protein
MRHKCFRFAEFILAFRCSAGDEVGGHLRLLDGISFLLLFLCVGWERGRNKQLWEQLVEAAPMFARYERTTSREIPMVLLRPVE